MRVLMIDDRYNMFYGAQQQAIEVAAQFTKHGHDSHFLTTSEGMLASRARDRGVQTHVVPAPPPWLRFERQALGTSVVSRGRNILTMLTYSRQVAKHLRTIEPDLVVASNVRSSLILAWARLTSRRPIMLYAQNDVPMGLYGFAAAYICRRFGMIGPSTIQTFPSLVRKRVIRNSFPLPGGRDLSQFTFSPEPALDGEQPPMVVSIASLNERKRLHDLIEAIALVRNRGLPAVLTIVGGSVGEESERYEQRLMEIAADLGVPTHFTGWQEDVRPFLADANLFAIASSNEGLPGVLVEAMACGRACVATRAGDAGRLVDDAGAGASVEVGDVAALADEIARLLSDDATRTRCAASGHAFVHAELDLSRMYNDLRSGLSDLVSFDS